MKAAVCALLLSCSPALAQELPAESFQRRKVLASDGAALALYRYVPAGGGGQFPAVLLIPDVAFAKEAYDFEGCGLARHLRAKGRDTFVVELRGQGSSSRPKDWRLRDWVEKDLPAAVAAIGQVHAGPIDLVVQGHGGSLALAATVSELQGRVNRVVAINTPVRVEVPNEIVRRTLRSGGRFSQLPKRDFEVLFALEGQFARGTLEEFRGLGLQDLSPAAAAELLAWMEKGRFEFSDGSTFEERIRRFDRTTFLLLPLLDNFSHPEAAAPLHDLAKKGAVSAQSLSKFDLLTEDYTHLSSLLGVSAESDVFERISIFLNAEPQP